MIIKRIAGATRTIGQAQGYLGLPLRDEQVDDPVTGPGTPSMVTAWEPTPAELALLNGGANVYLRVAGSAHPPVMLTVRHEGVAEESPDTMAGPQLFYFSRQAAPPARLEPRPLVMHGVIEAADVVAAWIALENMLIAHDDRSSRAAFKLIHLATATRSPEGFAALTLIHPKGYKPS